MSIFRFTRNKVVCTVNGKTVPIELMHRQQVRQFNDLMNISRDLAINGEAFIGMEATYDFVGLRDSLLVSLWKRVIGWRPR